MSKSRASPLTRASKSTKSLTGNRKSPPIGCFHSLRLERLEERCLLAGDVVYRVNAGGAAVAGTPGWTADTNAAPSPYRNSAAAPSGAFATTSAINLTNASIPAGTPPSLFQNERWGQFSYAIPVVNGTYDVKLYFVELYYGTSAPGGTGKRVFGMDILDTPGVDVQNLDI